MLPLPSCGELLRRCEQAGDRAARRLARAHAQARNDRRHPEQRRGRREVGDDEERRAEAQVQKLTDDNVKTLDDLLKHKEAEIMQV